VPSGNVDYFYHHLLGVQEDEQYDNEWLHWIDEFVAPSQIIIGLAPPSFGDPDEPPYSDFKGYRLTSIPEIETTMFEARKFLGERFGYRGQISVVAMPRYSFREWLCITLPTCRSTLSLTHSRLRRN